VAVGARLDDPQRSTGGGGSVRPVHGAMAGLAGALRYMDMVLHFRCFLFLWNRWSARISARGSYTGGGSRVGHAAARFKPQPSAMVGECFQGSAHDKVRPNGCGTEHRTPASDRWSSRSIARGMAMKRANIGFVSIFFEISMQLPSIYMGFGLIISCVCRSLSPSSQIQLGFDISFDFIEISASGISVSVTFWRRVGDDRCWAAPRPRTSKAGAGSAGPAGLNSALGQIKTGKGVFISILF
jgi:hypothetical protein